jgi:hypothetical protein
MALTLTFAKAMTSIFATMITMNYFAIETTRKCDRDNNEFIA